MVYSISICELMETYPTKQEQSEGLQSLAGRISHV